MGDGGAEWLAARGICGPTAPRVRHAPPAWCWPGRAFASTGCATGCACSSRSVLRSYLLGLEKRPEYICKLKGAEATKAIAAWWRERWLLRRIESDEVLDAVEQHTLTSPIRHGARVQLPDEEADQPSLFEDI